MIVKRTKRAVYVDLDQEFMGPLERVLRTTVRDAHRDGESFDDAAERVAQSRRLPHEPGWLSAKRVTRN